MKMTTVYKMVAMRPTGVADAFDGCEITWMGQDRWEDGIADWEGNGFNGETIYGEYAP